MKIYCIFPFLNTFTKILQIVNILYRENDWVYVIGLDTRQEGFIPYSYCTPYNNHLAELAIKKKLPREAHLASGDSLDTNHDW